MSKNLREILSWSLRAASACSPLIKFTEFVHLPPWPKVPVGAYLAWGVAWNLLAAWGLGSRPEGAGGNPGNVRERNGRLQFQAFAAAAAAALLCVVYLGVSSVHVEDSSFDGKYDPHVVRCEIRPEVRAEMDRDGIDEFEMIRRCHYDEAEVYVATDLLMKRLELLVPFCLALVALNFASAAFAVRNPVPAAPTEAPAAPANAGDP
jgi:hypothetical protein